MRLSHPRYHRKRVDRVVAFVNSTEPKGKEELEELEELVLVQDALPQESLRMTNNRKLSR